jgi:ribosomal protein S18 acetylase RimI-like enzyme
LEWAAEEEWVIDGFGPWDVIDDRFERAETVIFVDHPLWVHNWLSSERQVDAALGRGRIGGQENCDLREIHRQMFETIDRVHRDLRPKLLSAIERLPPERVLRVEGVEAMDALLATELLSAPTVEFVVRPARTEDVPTLARLHAAFLEGQARYLPAERRNPAFDGAEYFGRRLAEDHRATLVAVVGTDAIGFVDGMLFQKSGSQRGGIRRRLGLRRAEEPLELPVVEGYLNNVYVAPDVRGAGVAGALVEALAQWMSGRGAEALYTDVSDGNGDSARMFERAGFARVRTGFRRALSE